MRERNGFARAPFETGRPMSATVVDSTFEHILDSISDGVYVTTAERQIVYWSAGVERITGYRGDEVVGKHCHDNILVHTDLHGRRLCLGGCPLQDCTENGTARTVSEIFLRRKDGARLAVYVKTAAYDQDGSTFGAQVFGELQSVATRR
jgi:PAS domain S-box-containing protein